MSKGHTVLGVLYWISHSLKKRVKAALSPNMAAVHTPFGYCDVHLHNSAEDRQEGLRAPFRPQPSLEDLPDHVV